jgi:hypothetical protein
MKCEKHKNKNFWLQVGQADLPENYHCEGCRPPPSKVFVQRWLKQAKEQPAPTTPTLDEGEYAPPLHITNYEQPACPHCGCRWIAEHVTHAHAHADTVVTAAQPTLQCWSCKRPVSQDDLSRELLNPKPLPAIKHHRHRAVYARESGCVNIVPCR